VYKEDQTPNYDPGRKCHTLPYTIFPVTSFSTNYKQNSNVTINTVYEIKYDMYKIAPQIYFQTWTVDFWVFFSIFCKNGCFSKQSFSPETIHPTAKVPVSEEVNKEVPVPSRYTNFQLPTSTERTVLSITDDSVMPIIASHTE